MHVKKIYFITVLTCINYSLSLEIELQRFSRSLKNLSKMFIPFDFASYIEKSNHLEKKTIIHGYPVYFIKVLSQGATDCQLHGLKNALYSLKLLQDLPENVEQNLDLLTDENLYQSLVNEWTKITKTCSNVTTTAIDQVLEQIKNKNMPPHNLNSMVKNISDISASSLYPIHDTIVTIFKNLKTERDSLANNSSYLKAFLIRFSYLNKDNLNNLGQAHQNFQHAIALTAFKIDQKILFFVTDSWDGSSEYKEQKNEIIQNIVHALTMQEIDFYTWCAHYLATESEIYLKKGQKNISFAYAINAASALNVSLMLYKKMGSIPTEEAIYIKNLADELKSKNIEFTSVQKSLWNKKIEKLKELLNSLHLES